MPDNNSHNNPPEGYTEDEMGLLRDPDATGPQAWGRVGQFQQQTTTPPVNSQDSNSSVYDDVPKKMGPWRIVIAVVAIALVAAMVAVGIGGFSLYQSAKRVKATASDVQANASTLKDAFMNGDEAALRSSSAAINEGVHKMESEMATPLWSTASTLPFISTDISNARTLVSCAADLSDNALNPLVDSLGGVRLSDLMQDGRIDVDIIKRMRESVVAASPVIVKNADTMSQLPHGSVGEINEIIDKIRDPLTEASVVLEDADGLFGVILGILGDGGQTRNYIMLAQTNSEIRAAGGFPGSVGTLKIENGVMTMSDFETVYNLKHRCEEQDFYATISDDEREMIDPGLAQDAAGVTQTPDFVRSGELTREFWNAGYGEGVDGVIGIDPIFLQRMLALTGGVVADDGTEVNGDNAANEILSNVYWRYGYNGDYGAEQEDDFFSDVASKSADKLFSSLGSVDFSVLLETIVESGADHRFQVWMANPEEEDFMDQIGVSGKLETDPAKPVLGLYANDYTWSKISWYLDIWADIDEGTKNEDGTTTYHVVAHFRNNMTEDEAMTAPEYVYGSNPLKVSRGDMCDGLWIFAPAGGSIDNFQLIQGRDIPEGTTLLPLKHGELYGFDVWTGHVLIGTENEAVAEFDMIVPPEAVERPTVRTSPLCFQ